MAGYRVQFPFVFLCDICNYNYKHNEMPSFRLKVTFYFKEMGTSVAQWLRCCATNRKVAGSILDGVIGIFV